ncbi:MAG: CdaR family transcriptional regulator [Pleomorphochaeta sp.]
MELSKRDAAEIVKEISQLLNKKLNIMNNEGIIIASSTPSRINSFHEGAYNIISNKLNELEVQETNLDLEGTYKGLNFPIEINNEIIGVVGITGSSDETRAYGNIVKKMTEILIEGKIREEIKQNKESIRNYFLIDWISSTKFNYNQQLIQRGLQLNINIEKKRRIVCFELSLQDKKQLINLEKKIINKLYNFNDSNLIFKDSNIIVLATETLEKSTLNNQLNKLINFAIKEQANLYIGISKIVSEFYDINSYYLNAKHALNIQRIKNSTGFSYYNDLNIELIYEQIPIQIKNELIKKVFINYTSTNLSKDINILKVYYDNNCSIKYSSPLLNMHPNTLQYHLTKIKENTNLDPRNIKDSLILQLCIDFYFQLNF